MCDGCRAVAGGCRLQKIVVGGRLSVAVEDDAECRGVLITLCCVPKKFYFTSFINSQSFWVQSWIH